jgi:hypothetical protein
MFETNKYQSFPIKLRLPLFRKRLQSFLTILQPQIISHRLHRNCIGFPQVPLPTLPIKLLLAQRQNLGTEPSNLLHQLLLSLPQVSPGHHPAHQPEPISLLRRQSLAEHQHPHQALLVADESAEEDGWGCGEQACFDGWDYELRGLAGDYEVARDDQLAAGTRDQAVDYADHGCFQVAEAEAEGGATGE